MKNKKGIGGLEIAVIGFFFLIVIAITLIPVFVDSVDSADRAVLECNDALLDTLDTTYNLCTNASGVSVVNATPTEAGLTGSQETLLLIIPTFLVLAVLFIIAKKTGLI